MIQGIRTPPCLLFYLSQGSRHRLLPRVHDSAGKLPTPLVRYEAVPPEHEHTVLIVHDSSDRYVMQLHDMVLEAVNAGRLHINKCQLDPRIVINGALAVDLPRFQLAGRTDTNRTCADVARSYNVGTAIPHSQNLLRNEPRQYLA